MTSRRLLEQLGVPGAITAWMVIVGAVSAPRLPDPMAVHFTLGGSPDGTGSLLTLAVPVGGLWLLAWLAMVVVVRAGGDGWTAPAATATTYLLGGMLGSVWASVLTVNARADAWQMAELGPAGQIGAIVVGVTLGAAGWWIASDRPVRQHLRRPALVGDAGEALDMVWVGEATNRWTGGLGLVLMGVGVFLALPLWGDVLVGVGLLVVVVGAGVGLLSRLIVRIDAAGLTAEMGPFGWPRATVDLDDVRDVAIESVRPLAYGGWGYRRVPGARALVVRGGPGIRVRVGDGLDMIVTVDDAEVGASVLRTLADARR